MEPFAMCGTFFLPCSSLLYENAAGSQAGMACEALPF